MRKKLITITVEEDQFQQLRKLAEAERRTLSNFIGFIVYQYVNKVQEEVN